MCPISSRKFTPLARSVADKMHKDFAASKDPILPTVAELCRRYGVSHPLITSAGRLLAAQGFLELGRGRKMRLVLPQHGKPSATVHTKAPSSRRFFLYLHDLISDGTFRSGQPLPKLAAVATAQGISTKTALVALRELQSQGLVHKRGRSWIVGQERVPAAPAIRWPRPVILLVQNGEHAWASFLTERTAPFADTFMKEAASHQVMIKSVTMEAVARDEEFKPQAFGRTPLGRIIRSLGNRYQGCLLLESWPERQFRWLVACMARMEKSLVWMGRRGHGFEMDMRESGYFHCHADEAAVDSMCIRYLSQMGHVRCGYSSFAEEDWDATRLRRLQSLAAQFHPPLIVVPLRQSLLALCDADPGVLADRLQHQAKSGPGKSRILIEYLIREANLRDASLAWPEHCDSAFGRLARILKAYAAKNTRGDLSSLWMEDHLKKGLPGHEPMQALWNLERILPFLLDDACTAIVINHDATVPLVMRKLRQISLRIPEDVSLISFDNDLRRSSYGVNSIDHGAAYLGYAAFHRLYGDLPIKRDSAGGHILARPIVMDRGSVAWMGPRHRS